MMKFVLAFVAIIGLACGAVVPQETRDIHQDIQDFIKLIPVEKILSILVEHLSNDAEFQDGVAYLTSDEFKKALTVVEGKKELKALLDDLEGYDLKAYDFMNKINDLLGIAHIKPRHNARNLKTVKQLVDEIVATLPQDKIKALYDDKMKTSADFNKVMTHLQSADFKKTVDTLRATSEVQALERKLESYGITVDEIIALVKKFIGWTY